MFVAHSALLISVLYFLKIIYSGDIYIFLIMKSIIYYYYDHMDFLETVPYYLLSFTGFGGQYNSLQAKKKDNIIGETSAHGEGVPKLPI